MIERYIEEEAQEQEDVENKHATTAYIHNNLAASCCLALSSVIYSSVPPVTVTMDDQMSK